MLRINLLPSYVAQRRTNKKLIAGFTTAFAVIVAGLLLFQFLYLLPSVNTETQLAQAAVSAHTYITQDQTTASNIIATVAPIQLKIDFFHNTQAYNLDYPNLYLNVAKFTSPKILYTGMSVAGSTLTIDAYTPSIEELGRYLQVMYHEPDISSVSISSIPTPDQAAEKIYMYKGTVIGMSGGTGMTATGGAATSNVNLPGIPSGVNVSLPAGVTAPGGPTSGPGMEANGPGAQGAYRPPTPGSLPPLTPSGQGGGPGGNQTGGTSGPYALLLNDPDFNSKYFKVLIRRTDGFQFIATCSLKKAFSPPVVPSGGAGATSLPTSGGPG